MLIISFSYNYLFFIENKKNKSIGFSKVEALLKEADDAICNATSALSVLEETD